MSSVHTTAYQRLVAVAAGLKVPAAVRRVATEPPQDPRPGQIWRAAWKDVIQPLLVTSTGDDTLRAVPASFERYADGNTLLLPASASTLEEPLALWWGLEATVPWCVLDRQVSELSNCPASLTRHSLAGAVAGAPRGASTAESAAANEYRGLLAGRVAVLSAARWEPEGTGSLPQLLKDKAITPGDLAAELELLPPQALAVWRGKLPLTPDQAATLADRLGQRAEQLIAANPALPHEVVHELNRPLRRAQVKALAARYNEAEHDARLRAAYGIFALAARQDGPARPNWTARTDRYFELCLGE
ncbi:hypothetical protein AB0D10_35640 [Kitasatospora sp. NPDC048545]|uniref:hypothetical protein n=1 Tax=Kitasatospora sp. NPDC048545 TaxID=3157208 RepID=UPI0033F01D38